MQLTDAPDRQQLSVEPSGVVSLNRRRPIGRVLLDGDFTAVSVALGVAGLVFYLVSPTFVSPFNFDTLALFGAIAVVISLGQMFALSIGQFNLAIGSIGACGAVVAAALMQELGISVWIAVLAGLAVGVAAGALQGALIAFTPLNPFVVTLALSSVYLGIAIGSNERGLV